MERAKSASQIKIHEFYTDTCSYNQKSIEGYMLKEIESKKTLHVDAFHLRFFRIVQNTGKLVIKMEKSYQTFNIDKVENDSK